MTHPPDDRIHPDAEGTGCLFLLLSGVVAVGLIALLWLAMRGWAR
jgi:hypothetical protein